MHKEILTNGQTRLLSIIEMFSKQFGLVGGTAVALQIGHRRSIDFDLFSFDEFNNLTLLRKISRYKKIDRELVNKLGELTIIIDGVKITFFHYPFKISFTKKLDGFIKLPNLLTLAAMKAYAIGMRAKWKDYVDLYFIIKNHYSIKEIIGKGKKIFGNEFNEKIFRSQLAYFKDIDYKEKIDFIDKFAVSDREIKEELIKFSLILP